MVLLYACLQCTALSQPALLQVKEVTGKQSSTATPLLGHESASQPFQHPQSLEKITEDYVQ